MMNQIYFNTIQKYSLTPWDNEQSTYLPGKSQLKLKSKKFKNSKSKNKDISFRLYRQQLEQLRDSSDKASIFFQDKKSKSRKKMHDFSLPPINSLVKINIGSTEQSDNKVQIKRLMSNTSAKKLNTSTKNLRKYGTIPKNQEFMISKQDSVLTQKIGRKLKLNGIKCTKSVPKKGNNWVQQLYSPSNTNTRSAGITPYQFFANRKKEDVFKRILIQLQAKIK